MRNSNSHLELETKLDQAATTILEIGRNQPDKAAAICLEALQLADQFPNAPRTLKNQIGRSKILLSGLEIQRSRYDSALQHALAAREIYTAINLQSGIARSQEAIGLAHLHRGNLDTALEFLLSAKEQSRQVEDQRLQCSVLNNLGLLYLKMEDHQQAQDYLIQSLACGNLQSHLPDTSLMANLTEAYLSTGEYPQALTYSRMWHQTCQQTGDGYGETQAAIFIGRIFMAMGQLQEAKELFIVAREQAEVNDFSRLLAQSLTHLAELACREQDLPYASELLHSALIHAKKAGDGQQRAAALQMLSTVQQSLGNHQAALELFQEYHQQRESLINEDLVIRIRSLEFMHHLRQTQQDQESVRQENVELTREIQERKRIQSELERIITLDPLTSLLNRRHFFDQAQKELDRSRRYNRPLSILMLDIDYFKRVNDQYGHLVGDRVIIEVSRRIKDTLRKIDLACRYGGEEFAILLPETPLVQATMVANRLGRAIGSQPVIKTEYEISITVSLGVASFEHDSPVTVDAMLDRADKALYAAKQNGRNQVVVFSANLNV
jgi:diguanylate cyclase (GGDEF)-like protein